MRRIVSLVLILSSLIVNFSNNFSIFAEDINAGEVIWEKDGSINEYEEDESIYKIFTMTGELIAEKQSVNVGDSILTKDFIKYLITDVDKEKKIAFAEFEEYVKKPHIDISFKPNNISQMKPTICLYMTHNDESYIDGDGYDSIYGAGGIHDIAKTLQRNLEFLGITTYIDETLHVPHDIYAYSRSSKTAKNMLDAFSPDAIFDIHRDGASRSTYVKKVDGYERCKIRIVVGKASSNFEVAEQFALYLLSVAEEVCDWLFLDIYYASGHYNQGLYGKALLFEMGSHLVEKSLVMKTVPELANVINIALFNTTVDTENGNLTINGEQTEETPVINDILEEKYEEVVEEAIIEQESKKSNFPVVVYFIIVIMGAIGLSLIILRILGYDIKGKKRKSKRKKS